MVPFPARLGKPAEFAALVGHIVNNGYLNGEVIASTAPSAWPPSDETPPCWHLRRHGSSVPIHHFLKRTAMSTDPIVIVSAARTPMGSFQGDFAPLAAHDLGGAAIRAAVERAGLPPSQVDEVLMGNCLMAGQGQAPARQAAFKVACPSAPARSPSAKCAAPACAPSCLPLAYWPRAALMSSSLAAQSMTNAPYLLPKAPRWLPHWS